MRLLEAEDDKNIEIHKLLQGIINDNFGKDISDDDALELSRKLSLSDILALDDATELDDIPAIKELLTPHIQLEYSYPGHTNLKSKAYSRPTSQKTGGVPADSGGSDNTVAGSKTVATGRPNNGAEIDDTEEDTELAEDLAQLKRRIARCDHS